MNEESKGFLYIAMSDILEEARASAESLKRNMPKANIALITDRETDDEIFDVIRVIEDPEKGFGDKPKFMEPIFEKTIYLDTDIYISDDISEIFTVLDNFDLAAAYAPKRKSPKTEVPLAFPPLNSGVIAMRDNRRVREFLDDWATCYDEFRVNKGIEADQPSFHKTLYDSELRLNILPPKYNLRFMFPGYIDGEAKIFHGRLRDVSTEGMVKSRDIDDVNRKINRFHSSRVYYTKNSRLKVKRNTRKLSQRIKESIEEVGLKKTFLKGSNKIRLFLFN